MTTEKPEASPAGCTCGVTWPCPLHGGPPEGPISAPPVPPGTLGQDWVSKVTSEEQEHINELFDHFNWLRTHGWREAMRAPRDGTEFECIEIGSTGIHRASWLLDGFLIDGDWPTRFILWRPLP